MTDWKLFRWSCPKCGLRSRIAHRYESARQSFSDQRDPGDCAKGAQLLLFPLSPSN